MIFSRFSTRYKRLAALVLAVSMLGCASKSALDVEKEGVTESVEKQELQKRAAIRIQLAVGYYQQGQQKVALEEIRQALAITPDLLDAYALRALIFMDMGEKQLAEDNFLRALKIAPANVDIANNYGWFLCQNGREKQGLQYLERAMKDPTYATPGKAFNNAGLCSLRLRDVNAAEAFFLQGFRQEPSNPGINANLAKIYFDRGDYAQARFYIGRVLKMEVMAADVLWLAIKIEKRSGDEAAVAGLATQLRRRHPGSKEFLLLQKGAFDE